ncbi:glycosyltransferase [Cyanobacterium stanieri LEGE 03274]|uniref:Glycosyltransferase n=1 Tax=Cyanobacterium stanieri LEGE 03274 TaxID=1828756 RepID=A0ABR9V0S5_9CHRO|nr:glycosyltransferase [Cyanobacterium stanieri]MBE9221485.1 glycosyltransferase [Cyanobacterium stanieri LEGE 03274]
MHNEVKPKVAFYLRMLSGGGAEKVIINLTKGLVEKGITVDLILNIPAGPYLKEVSPEVRIITLGTPKLLKGLPKLVNYLKKEKPQILFSAMHYNNEIAIWAKYLARVKTKVIVSEHNTLSVHAKNQTGSEKWSPLFAKLFYPLANEIVTVSHGSAKDLAKVTGIPPSKIKVIYNPVITPELLAKAQQSINHPWFEAQQPPVILAVGRLNQQKDYPTLIKAFAKVKQIKPCRLMILGQGPEKKKLNDLINQLNLKEDIILQGFVENPYAYMKKATMLVLSSQWEGLPTVLIESLAVGTSVVSTNCPSGPEEILDHGKYGTLVPILDVKLLSEAILDILSGEIKSIDTEWLEQFTLAKVTQQYVDLFSVPL